LNDDRWHQKPLADRSKWRSIIWEFLLGQAHWLVLIRHKAETRVGSVHTDGNTHIILRARHIAASFNVEKLVRRIPYHFPCFCAKQQNSNCSIGVIPNTKTSQMYTTTTTTTHETVTGVRLHQHLQIMPCNNRPTTHRLIGITSSSNGAKRQSTKYMKQTPAQGGINGYSRSSENPQSGWCRCWLMQSITHCRAPRCNRRQAHHHDELTNVLQNANKLKVIQLFYCYDIVSNAGLYCRSNAIVKILFMVRIFFVVVFLGFFSEGILVQWVRPYQGKYVAFYVVQHHCLTSLGQTQWGQAMSLAVCTHGVTNGDTNSTYNSLADELRVCMAQ
jgi:hypothetical protein